MRAQRPRFIPGGRKPATGLALVELMVALTIALFLIGGMAVIFQNVRTTYTEQQGMSQLQDNARLGLTLMTDVIESAGYFPDPLLYSAPAAMPVSANFATAGTPVVIGNTNAQGDIVTVRYAPDNSKDLYNCMGGTNTISPYDSWENTFSVVSTGGITGALQCAFWSKQNGASGPVTLISNLTNGTGGEPKGMTLAYGLSTVADTAGTCLDTYKPQALMAAGDWKNVCSVKVTLNFVNPVPPPGANATNNFISYTIVIPIMNAAGGST